MREGIVIEIEVEKGGEEVEVGEGVEGVVAEVEVGEFIPGVGQYW